MEFIPLAAKNSRMTFVFFWHKQKSNPAGLVEGWKGWGGEVSGISVSGLAWDVGVEVSL